MKKSFLITILLVLLSPAVQPAICQKARRPVRRTIKPAAPAAEQIKPADSAVDKSKPVEETKISAPIPERRKAVKPDAEPPIVDIKHVANFSVKITRSSFKSGNTTSPAWTVRVNVKNLTNKQLELGESLIILETARVFPLYVGNYGLRELEQPTDHAQNFKDRYLLDWGYTADTKGLGTIIFPVTNASPTDIFMALLTSAGAPDIGEHEGTGYGQVKPHSERVLSTVIPTPMGIAKSDLRDQVIVILPRMRVIGNASLPMAHTILRFNVGNLKEGDAFDAPETSQIALTPPELRTVVTDDKQPIWLRLFALNWFAETDSKEAASLLLQYAIANSSYAKQDLAIKPEELDPAKLEAALLDKIKGITTAYLLQTSSIINLGTWKIKTSTGPLVELLQKTDNRILKVVTIEALGEIGDPTAAAPVRLSLKDSDEAISNTAIEAVGKLKDGDSVSTLLEILSKGKESGSSRLIKQNPYDKAAMALGSIGTQQARDGLLDVMLNSRETKLRVSAARALSNISSPPVTAGFMTVVSDTKAPEDLKTVAIPSLSKIGGPEVLAVLRVAADSDSRAVRQSAISALAAINDPGGKVSLIALAERSNYASRDQAINTLAENKVQDSLPVLRRIVLDPQSTSSTRVAACRALTSMQDNEAKQTLLAVATDSSNSELYVAALTSLNSLFGNRDSAVFIASVKSKHKDVRAQAAGIIKEQNTTGAIPALWGAYQIESDRWTGDAISSALIALKFSDPNAVPFLANRIDEKKNPLWSGDLQLLRSLNSAESVAALVGATENISANVQREAIENLAAIRTGAATAALIALAQRNGYRSRERAIYELTNGKVIEALPALRAIVADIQSPVAIRRDACSALGALGDKQSKETLLSVADDNDAGLYEAALSSLDTIFGGEAAAAFIKGLGSRHKSIRKQSASYLETRKATQAVEQLWQAYQSEPDEYTADTIASALIELKFSQQNAVAFLINRLDPKKNELWSVDVKLLRHLTGQKFGPDHKYVDKKVRDSELEKWRTWWANENKPQ